MIKAFDSGIYFLYFVTIKLLIMENILLFNFFGPEMIVVLFAILLLFGGKKIPELMRGIGKGIREFNAARSSLESELKEGMREAEKKELEEKQNKDA